MGARVVAAFSRPQVRGEQKPRKVKLGRRTASPTRRMRNPKKTVTDVEDMGAALGEKEEKKAKGPRTWSRSQAKASRRMLQTHRGIRP